MRISNITYLLLSLCLCLSVSVSVSLIPVTTQRHSNDTAVAVAVEAVAAPPSRHQWPRTDALKVLLQLLTTRKTRLIYWFDDDQAITQQPSSFFGEDSTVSELTPRAMEFFLAAGISSPSSRFGAGFGCIGE